MSESKRDLPSVEWADDEGTFLGDSAGDSVISEPSAYVARI